MSSALINNASQIYFDSVFGMENEGMNASVRDDKVVGTVQEKSVEFTEEVFDGTFELPTEGLTDMSDVPKDLVFDARTAFSSDVTVKAGSFDAVAHERFLMMSAIHGSTRPRLGGIEGFPTSEDSYGNDCGHVCCEKQNITVDVDEPAEDEPIVKKKAASKRRPAPAVGEPVAKKKRTNAGRASPTEKGLAMVPVVQDVEPLSTITVSTAKAQQRRTPKKKLVLQDLMMETDFVEPGITRSAEIELGHSIAINDEDDNLDGAENEMASFTAPKQFLKEPLRSGEDDDLSGSKQPSKIIDPAAAEKNKEIVSVATEDLSLTKSVATMTDSEDTEPLSKVLELTNKSKSDEEPMSIEDILKQIPEAMMLPSVTATEITRIKFGLGIEIPGVNEGDWYKASLPRIATSNKGKAPLVAHDEIKGHPAREMFSFICAYIDFIIQLREKVIADVVILFYSFSLSRLAVLDSVKDIVAKEEQMLTSSCWIRTMILVDGSWIIQGGDFLKPIPRPVASSQWELLPQRQYDDTLAPISEFFKMLRKHWADVCIEVVPFSAFGPLQQVDVQLISSDSSFVHPNPNSLSNSSTSTSPMDFVADIPQLEQSPTASTQILMPTTAIPATDFTESFAQLRASITQLSIKQLRTKDSTGDLKNQLLSKIDHLEKSLAEAYTQQDQVLRDLADIRKEVQDQNAAMLAFREESQEHYSTLPEHLVEIIAYINRGRDDKKGECGSSQGPQPPPDDKSRPSGGGGSRSEPPRKRESGGSQSGRQRDWRYWIGGN
ncbi:splicing factor 3B subunit 1-like [Dorcoceras hygrometricum]|uniref:Splicing factor 3B subunit 1-like n=1 Tax=Dorcoceras hygrometricum TaxID=472368 RepID=A0A2Z7CCK5_9LAMI|nr:splicing factor 3B subunit 1-like [Dorcoceras hygrometricum]